MPIYGDKAGTLDTGTPPLNCIAYSVHLPEVACTLDASYANKWGLEDQHINGGAKLFVQVENIIRRITPLEAERLMGFPDQYTLVKYRGKLAADTPRYKALGNSICTNVLYWIGARIDRFTKLCL